MIAVILEVLRGVLRLLEVASAHGHKPTAKEAAELAADAAEIAKFGRSSRAAAEPGG